LAYSTRGRKRIFKRRRFSAKLTPRAKITGARAQPRLRRRKTLLTPRAIWALVGAGAALFLIILLIVLLSSPAAGDLTPAEGSLVNGNPIAIEASLRGSIDPGQVKLIVDGQDCTEQARIEASVLKAEMPLEDGEHLVEVMVAGKLEASSRFVLDNTPPVVHVDEWEARDDGITIIRGRVEGGDTLLVESGAVPLNEDGSFQVEVDRFKSSSVELIAVDAAGNRRELLLDTAPPPEIKGIHVSAWVAADRAFFRDMVDLVDRTELNGMEIDIKDEWGKIGYPSEVPLALEIGSAVTQGGIDIDRVMDKCWYNDIYPIARVVCFKDPILAQKRPDLAVQSSGGGLWGDGNWVDPYSREVWDYLLGIAMEAARKGFKEIQLDYVRFPSDGNTDTCVFPFYDGREKTQVIEDFLEYMRNGLKQLGVVFSADVFGLTASDQGAMGIGQDIHAMAQYLDYLCPMVYPSHYNTGEYGIGDPEANPHDIVWNSLKDFQAKLEGTACKLRPWLQDFSLRYQYGPAQVQAQINACRELDIDEWLLWDPHCTFTESVLAPAQTEEQPPE